MRSHQLSPLLKIRCKSIFEWKYWFELLCFLKEHSKGPISARQALLPGSFTRFYPGPQGFFCFLQVAWVTYPVLPSTAHKACLLQFGGLHSTATAVLGSHSMVHLQNFGVFYCNWAVLSPLAFVWPTFLSGPGEQVCRGHWACPCSPSHRSGSSISELKQEELFFPLITEATQPWESPRFQACGLSGEVAVWGRFLF